MSTLTHFELYAGDPATVAEFYRELLGWKIEQAPGIDYWRIQTGNGEAQSLSGGLTRRPENGPQSWIHYVEVDSVDKTIERLEQLGGRVIRPKTAVPKTAWVAVVADPEGNTFGIWHADSTAFPAPEPD